MNYKEGDVVICIKDQAPCYKGDMRTVKQYRTKFSSMDCILYIPARSDDSEEGFWANPSKENPNFRLATGEEKRFYNYNKTFNNKLENIVDENT